MKNKILIAIGVVLLFSACQNKSQVFPNFTYQTVYFAYQHPVRTITLGEDIVNTDLDNAHQCRIYATLGGVYTNTKNVNIGFSVDNSLVNNVVFTDGSPVLAMPSSYYTLASNQIIIPKDSIEGGVTVQLTDAFFADPNSIKNTYVIPIKMNSVNNSDSILADKNYILYAIKYVNPWHGYYLRRGVDVIKGKNGLTSLDSTNIRHAQYVEYDDIQMLTTNSLNTVNFPLVFKDQNGYNVNCNLLLKFDDQGSCVISSGTSGITATGSGKFVKKGDKDSWGGVDRDAMFLQYQIDFPNMQVATTDTLVMRNRGVTMETF
ncbi:DUF5627 domain-containing protein [Arachidicoccus sp.]|uniref:DUF5627 domain-containing protein n=1 Tax=Arachidicoccus sp. TaxID=1872624 RepID=UPI003D1CE496